MSTLRRDFLLLVAISIIFFGIFLGNRPLTVPDEGRYAEIPREMLASHDFVTPHLNGIKYFEKPPLFYWMQSLSIKAMGLSTWSVRIMNALMAFVTLLMTYWTGRELYSRETGFISAVILASCGLFAGMARMVTIDMTLTAMLSGCLFSFLLATKTKDKSLFDNYLLATYAFAGLATMTKGLVGFLLPGAVMCSWFLVCNQWSRLREFITIKGLLLFSAITIPWHLMAQYYNPEFARFYFLDQQFLRYLADTTDREKPLWFLPIITFVGLFPWCSWLIQALKFNWPTNVDRKQGQASIFLMLWASIIFVFFWVSHSQLAPYIIPVYPALALLLGHYFADRINKKPNLGIYLGFIITSMLATAIGLLGIIFISQSNALVFSSMLLIVGSFQAIYYMIRKGIKKALITVCVFMGVFILSLYYSLPQTDVRSIEPLAEKLAQITTPDTIIANYQHYYLDLPVYLNRNILLVNWYGELKLGIQHQDTNGLWTTENSFWQQWDHNTKNMYMLLSIKDYNRLKQERQHALYEIARTKRDILTTNRSNLS